MDETGKENVGFSLLTTETPLNINNDDQEDVEAEEDQRRRQQELENMMQYAFDDIGDEENSTMNSSFEISSGHVLTSAHTENSLHNSDINLEKQFRNAEYNSVDQLQVLYQVQDREIKRLNTELTNLKEERDKEVTGLKRKLLLMENEHNGTSITLKQCQDLLIEKKRDLDEHLAEINNLKDTINTLTLSKRDTEEEVQIWKTKFVELDQKMNLIDQGLYLPVPERQIRNKYEQQIKELQQNLEDAQKNLEKAIKAKSIAENETKDLKQTHELLALEKEEKIHDLYNQLENSKFQCHNLTDRVGSLEKEYQNLTQMLNTTKEESVQFTGSTKTLHQELKRALDEIKFKRDEIIKLETYLDEQKNMEIELRKKICDLEEKCVTFSNDNEKLLHEKELLQDKINKNNVKLEDLEEVNSNLKDEILKKVTQKINQQSQTDERRNSYELVKKDNEIEILKMQNDQLYKQLEETNKLKKEIELQSLKRIQELQNEMKHFPTDKRNEENYQILKTKYDNLQKQHEEAENNTETYKKQFEKYQQLCLELEKNCASLKTQVYEYHSKINEMEEKLVLKEKRDDLLDDLQQKALMFEEYIKNKSEVALVNKSMNTDNDFDKLLNEKLVEVINENKTLKEKIIFDRTALHELTEVWTAEINRLNTLIKEFKKEIESKNLFIEKLKQNYNEEIAQMGTLINKLSEALRNKEQHLKEIQEKDKNFKQIQEQLKEKIKSEYRSKESKLLTQFEKNMEEMKSKFKKDEESTKIKLENAKKRYVNGLEQINENINSQMKYATEKFALETKIIETYYDLLIQQTLSKKK